MTNPALSGAVGPSPSPGPGPAPLSTALSDRAGEAGVHGPEIGDPLTKALLSLDSISADVPEGAVTRRSPSRREEILDGAAALFAERGYHGASLRDISRRVGISHPGMLHHFASKDALLGAVIDRLEQHAQGLIDATGELKRSPQALLAALAGVWNPTTHLMTLLATLSAETVNPEHPGRFRIARLRLVHEHVIEQVLASFQERGLLVEGADPSFLARTTVSVMLSLSVRENSVRALQKNGDGDPVQDLQQLVRSFLRD
ncbi:TetR/AcrR family transcriptional regulator [Brachybacterium timonense]|uniref:TetR/AcrR family transcriptional regulator n=1 Tax=Brachybacterium timonense TaxID=2050896 RepID=UPI000D0B3575|nr:TetR/AcrR family transcriptional regulator [Brachybacterium timonense]